MKSFLLVLFLICLNGFYSQDTIVFFDGEKLAVKIVEIAPKYIKYKHLDSTKKNDNITLDKIDINSIILNNGKIFYFESKFPQDFVKDSLIYLGYTDVHRYFRGYRKYLTFAILGTALLSPIVTFYPIYLNAKKEIGNDVHLRPYLMEISYSKVKKRNTFYNNPIFIKSYKNEAKKMQRKRVWSAYAFGSFINSSILTITLSIINYQYIYDKISLYL